LDGDASRCGDDAVSDPLINTTIDKYRVVGRLGCGGMGVVYRVKHVALDKPFVLK
jgi:serine/threonine protein kinase